LNTFDTHHNLRTNGAPDHIVTAEEFEEYYSNISCSFDLDEGFIQMITNAWNLDGTMVN
jgi:hypothetical protein